MENAQEVKQDKINNSNSAKGWFYKIIFLLIVIVSGFQYLTSYLVASEIKKELYIGFDGIDFNEVKVTQGFLDVRISAKVVPLNRFNETQYTDLIQDLEMTISVLGANIDKVKQIVNQPSKYERYTLEGTGSLSSDEFYSPLFAQFMLGGDFVLKAEEAETSELLDGDVFAYFKGDILTIARRNKDVTLTYEVKATSFYTPFGSVSADAITYEYNSTNLPLLKVTGLNVLSTGATLTDLFLGNNVDAPASSIESNFELEGLDVDSLIYALSIYQGIESLDDGDFERTKLEANLQELAKRLVENSVSLKADLALNDRGNVTMYEIDLKMQSEAGIGNYTDMLTALSGDIDRLGKRPIAANLKKLDDIFRGLSNKSKGLRYRAVAMQ
ncbi:MAG: hypothetical protein RPR40_07900 [Bermanella sp.]